MITDFKYIASLIQSLHDGSISDTQRIELEDWIKEDQQRRELVENVNNWNFIQEDLSKYHLASIKSSAQRSSAIQQRVQERIHPIRFSARKHYAVLTAALVACCLLFLWIGQKYTSKKTEVIEISLEDPALAIKPTVGTPTITLPNGEQISLSDKEQGVVIGETITYTDGSELAAMNAVELQDQAVLALTTPAKSNYHIKLSDGSEVWLNEKSTLRYPKKFGKGDRVVELEGEGFFEVQKAKDRKAFLVKSKDQTIRVLGTQFNLSTNTDGNLTKTTLVEGSVEVESVQTAQRLVITPNQQAVFNGKDFQRKSVNVEQYIAWKSGNFYFDGQDPEMAFKDISTWYDLEIINPKAAKLSFFGYVEKSNDLATVLQILKDSGLQFKVRKQNERLQLQIVKE